MKYGYYITYLAKKDLTISISGSMIILISFKMDSDVAIRRMQNYIAKTNSVKEVIILNWKRIKVYEQEPSINTEAASHT